MVCQENWKLFSLIFKMKKPSTNKKIKPSQSPSIFQEKLFSPFLLLVFILISLIVFYSAEYCYISRVHVDDDNEATNRTIPVVVERLPFAIGKASKGCDIFSGRWVRDHTRPLYEEWECPYIAPQLTCLEHGRPEKNYLYWRWQPYLCSIPSFNATLMLEAIRGKKLMFVGDSLGRGHFTSMICLLHRTIPKNAKSLKTSGSLTIFTAKDYNATVEFYWVPFLLESNSDDPQNHRESDRIVLDGSIEKHAQHWRDADILVFNTYKWWISGFRILRGSFKDEVQDINENGFRMVIRALVKWIKNLVNLKSVPNEDGYRMAIKALVKWINNNIDPKKKRAFFTTMSPTHKRSELWGGPSEGNCFNETTIINDPTFFGAESSFMPILSEELSKARVPITVINITQLSSARKDSHTTIYKQQWHALTEQQLADPKSYADCVHWCLPGLQDIWNELLFAKLFYP